MSGTDFNFLAPLAAPKRCVTCGQFIGNTKSNKCKAHRRSPWTVVAAFLAIAAALVEAGALMFFGSNPK